MKKTLTAIASVLLSAGIISCSTQIQKDSIIPKVESAPLKLELKVGMPMPKPRGSFAGFEIYQLCGKYPEKLPFASYNHRTEILYLDTIKENNSPGPDGKIDFIIHNSKTIPPFQFAPPCPQPL